MYGRSDFTPHIPLTSGTAHLSFWSGGQVVRWSGGQVVRWSGGQVVRWSGGQVVRWSGGQVSTKKRKRKLTFAKAQTAQNFDQ